jgi:hypothetical protein
LFGDPIAVGSDQEVITSKASRGKRNALVAIRLGDWRVVVAFVETKSADCVSVAIAQRASKSAAHNVISNGAKRACILARNYRLRR